jgi:hypothetical protein
VKKIVWDTGLGLHGVDKGSMHAVEHRYDLFSKYIQYMYNYDGEITSAPWFQKMQHADSVDGQTYSSLPIF